QQGDLVLTSAWIDADCGPRWATVNPVPRESCPSVFPSHTAVHGEQQVGAQMVLFGNARIELDGPARFCICLGALSLCRVFCETGWGFGFFGLRVPVSISPF